LVVWRTRRYEQSPSVNTEVIVVTVVTLAIEESGCRPRFAASCEDADK
jgi:hypothetical protein